MDDAALHGRRALVTGSSRGIGRAIALQLAAMGADVAVNYATNVPAADEVVDRIRTAGRQSFAVAADVGREPQLRALFDRVEAEWGGLDIYVNNAIDVASAGPIRQLRADAWRHTLDSHVTTMLIASQRAVGLMQGRPGVIVGMSSLGARSYVGDYAPIGVGKAAIESLTRYLAVEFGPLGVRVNTVCPGPIDTEGLRRFRTFARLEEVATTLAPGRRMGLPEDVAGVVGFLCTESARWIYGQTIVVDGGLSLLSAT